jgi:predicted LPLAT superfamily acyltransferase
VARGKGVFVGVAHLGAQHIGGMLLTLKGYSVSGLRDRNESGIRRYVQDRFDRRHPDIERTRMIFADSFPREIFRCYREGCLVGSAMDISRVRSPNQKVEWIEVFGQKRPFLTGPLHIALRSKAPMLRGFVLPEPNFRFRFEIAGLQLHPETVDDSDQAVADALRAYAAAIEETLTQRPSLVSRI